MDVPNAPKLPPAECPKLHSFHLDEYKMILRPSRNTVNNYVSVNKKTLPNNYAYQIQRQLL